MADSAKPKLAPPGAGLPFLEGLVLRYVIYPWSIGGFSWQSSLDRLEWETSLIKDITVPIPEAAFHRLVLVRRLAGMEDSSRHWSIGMTLKHLTISMRSMSAIAESLAQGIVPDVVPSTANVKPPENLPPSEEVLHEFLTTAADVATALTPLGATANERKMLKHPFFGPLPAKGWLWALGTHQALHRRQIERIISDLRRKK